MARRLPRDNETARMLLEFGSYNYTVAPVDADSALSVDDPEKEKDSPVTACRRKLIEVSLPLEAIDAASAREKSIRHGHPLTLHPWWARRPLASCRAVLFAQIVDAPPPWPVEFPTEEAQARERKRLHEVIAEMVQWKASGNRHVMGKARYEIARSLARGRGEAPPARGDADAVLAYLAEHAPPVCDPFCGGGSIPLEAQRLGLGAHGSDSVKRPWGST